MSTNTVVTAAEVIAMMEAEGVPAPNQWDVETNKVLQELIGKGLFTNDQINMATSAVSHTTVVQFCQEYKQAQEKGDQEATDKVALDIARAINAWSTGGTV